MFSIHINHDDFFFFSSMVWFQSYKKKEKEKEILRMRIPEWNEAKSKKAKRYNAKEKNKLLRYNKISDSISI